MIIDRMDVSCLHSVRTLLGIGGEDDATLTDADILDAAVIDVAEWRVAEQLSDSEDVSSPRVRLAVIYTMAALLCPAMPARIDIKVQGIDNGWSRQPADYNLLESKLQAQADWLIHSLLTGPSPGASEALPEASEGTDGEMQA
ncbi:hypothetical protein [Paenibacillus tengchongensis]|uniref:hypothetical protein n=1 Tax=Paenibacillus tengchongensis TaxID=2608684 RepID=UPI00124C0E42|nr:hypothetical protein [Paenibacillus tengchongensis]